MEDRHPEAGSKALAGKIWYEGYDSPKWLWQSCLLYTSSYAINQADGIQYQYLSGSGYEDRGTACLLYTSH